MSSMTLSSLLLVVSSVAAAAQVDNKFHITPEEQAACEGDATALCSAVFPDQEALIRCMKANEASLSPTCRKTFVAGLKRRNL